MAFINDLISGKMNPNYQAPKAKTPKTSAPNTGVPTTKSVPNTGPRGVYWIGEDGNVYIKENANPNSVQNYGPSATLGYKSFDALNGLTEIPDPVTAERDAAKAAEDAALKALADATAAANRRVIPDRSASIALQNAGLASVDTNTQNTKNQITKQRSDLEGEYDIEAGINEANYTGQSTVNQQNLQKNKQTALVNAAQGRRGLFGTLASIGALSGSGIDLANRAVARGANMDLAGAGDTFEENQAGLESSIGLFRDADAKRRRYADRAATDAATRAENAGLISKQKYYTQLANDYADMEQRGNRDRYTKLASDLYPEIARTNVAETTSLSPQAAAYSPSTLANYLAGAQNTNVEVTGGTPGGLPGLIATPRRRKVAA